LAPISGAPEYREAMAGHERPEIARVVGASHAKPALVVLLAIVALIGAATWKPWAIAPDMQARPTLAEVAVQPSPASVVTLGGVQPILALDASIMGFTDGHRAWGVAAAYVPVTEIAVAARRRLPSVTPVVDWKAAEPAHRIEIPATAQAVATVALAVTWPSDTLPRDIRLFYRTPAVQVGPELSVRPRTREIPLVRPFPGIAMFEWQAGSDVVDPSHLSWSRASGVFYLPPSEPLPLRPRDWLTSGWPAGEYEFRVQNVDARTSAVRFSLRGASEAPVP
jgi:hypothetical protein